MHFHMSFFLNIFLHLVKNHLYNIIKKFSDMTKMQNMVKCIDNYHIPLYEKSKKKNSSYNMGLL
jgi:hypothetical protein